MNFSFVFKLYFSSALKYLQLNYKFLSCIYHFLSTSTLGGAMRFFKNASKKVVQGQGKKLVRSWKGAPKRDVFPSTQEKNGGRSQKTEK